MNLHRRLCRVLLLAIVLIAAQALGLAHRTVHGPASWTAAKTSAYPSAGDTFAGHEAGSVECRLLDACGLAGPPGVPLAPLPPALDGFVLSRSHGEFVARWVALFDARGPPTRS